MADWYWKGATSTNWAVDGNWTTDAGGGTPKANYPNASTENVYACTSPTNTTLTVNATVETGIFNMTGTSGITVAGASSLSVFGNFTLDASVTWTHTGSLIFKGTLNVDTAGKSFATSALCTMGYGGSITLINNNLNTGTKRLAIYNGSLTTNNLQIDCGEFSDAGLASAVTLSLGTSVINCTEFSFAACTLTTTAGMAPVITITATVDRTLDFGEADWHETTVTVVATGGKVVTIGDTAGTMKLDKFKITWTTDNIVSALVLCGDMTFMNATADAFELVGSAVVARPMVRSNTYGTARHIHANTTDITAAVDFRDIHFDPHTVDLSAIASGNCGGNEGITFRTVDIYYAKTLTANRLWTDDIWSTDETGAAAEGTGVFPLPQDTAVLNDYSGNNTNVLLTTPYYHRIGNIDASGLTETLRLAPFTYVGTICYGSIILTGSGISISSNTALFFVDARLKDELATTLDINILPSYTNGPITIDSYGGTVRLLTNNLTNTSTFTLTRGTFDLNGKTLSCGTFSSSNANTRKLHDDVGGGKVICTGASGTPFTMATSTGLTVEDAPDITFTPTTATADITMSPPGSSFTFGDIYLSYHAGDYQYIIDNNLPCAAFTLQTPVGSTFTKAHVTAGKTITPSGTISLVGDATHLITFGSTTTSAFTLSSAGAVEARYCILDYCTGSGGGTFKSYYPGTGTNTGWTFLNEFINVNGGEWNTTANWSYGTVPVSTDDVVITASLNAGQTITITTTSANGKSVDFTTAGNPFTLSGAANIVINGSITLKTGMTWSSTGGIWPASMASGTLTLNGVDISSCGSLNKRGAGTLTLASDVNIGAKAFHVYVFSGSPTLDTGNYAITCGTFDDYSTAGAVTLDLGTSVINCSNVSFAAATLTVTDPNTATFNISSTSLITTALNNVDWGGATFNITYTPASGTAYRIYFNGASTILGALNINMAADNRTSYVDINNDFSIEGNSTWKAGGIGYDNPNIRLLVRSSVLGTPRTVLFTAASKTLTLTDVDIQDMIISATNSPTITGTRVGDCGGNTNIDADATKTVYLDGASLSANFYDNVWSTDAVGERDGTLCALENFPLPQDIAIIDNYSWDITGKNLSLNVPRLPAIDASGLTEANTITLSGTSFIHYGDLNLSGSGVTISSASTVSNFDARLTGGTLTITPPAGGIGAGGITIDSYGGTVRLLTNNLTHTGTFTLTRGTFDLNGLTLSCGTFSCSNANVRTLQSSAAGGKIIETAGTGTVINMATDTNLVIKKTGD